MGVHTAWLTAAPARATPCMFPLTSLLAVVARFILITPYLNAEKDLLASNSLVWKFLQSLSLTTNLISSSFRPKTHFTHVRVGTYRREGCLNCRVGNSYKQHSQLISCIDLANNSISHFFSSILPTIQPISIPYPKNE